MVTPLRCRPKVSRQLHEATTCAGGCGLVGALGFYHITQSSLVKEPPWDAPMTPTKQIAPSRWHCLSDTIPTGHSASKKVRKTLASYRGLFVVVSPGFVSPGSCHLKEGIATGGIYWVLTIWGLLGNQDSCLRGSVQLRVEHYIRSGLHCQRLSLTFLC